MLWYIEGGTPEPCTPLGRFCIANATCDTVNKRCVCPPGTFGNGLIDCVDNDFDNCLVSEDPKITQFPGSKGALFLPCRKRLAKFLVQVEGTDLYCRFIIYGTSELASMGRVFENEVEIHFSVGRLEADDDEDSDETTFVADSSIYFRVNEEDGVRYTTSDRGWLANGNAWTRSPWQEDVTISFADVTIDVTFNSDNIMTWRVAACDTTVKFRPYVRREKPQTRVPGICINAPPRALFEDSSCRFPNVLCAAPDDDPSFLQQAAEGLGLTVDQYLMYASLRYAPKQTRGKFKFECYLICNMFKTKCSRADQILAIQICSSLVSNRGTLSCIQDIQTEYNVMDLFQKCVQFACLKDFYSCKAIFKFTKRCPKAMNLKNLDCGPAPLVGPNKIGGNV
ncbi:hypothetical protein ACOMHN_014741 [Nucella lapillus]